jgi:tetratricopeptide (TPR) repeat protein
MKRFGLFLILIVLSMAPRAYSADDVVTQAMKLYEKRHYDEAIGLLRSDPAAIEHAKQNTAFLTLGMAYFKNAVLHAELSRAAASASQDYLKKLAAAQRTARSLFVDLYLGETLVETGKPGVAAIYFERFSGNESVEPRYRTIAKVGLGLCYHLSNEAPKAASLWSTIDPADSEVKSELAAAYSKAGLADKNPGKMADEILAEARKSGKPLSMRLVKNVIAVYARAGYMEKGLDLLKRSDLKAYSYRETLGKSKVINFYDLSLLNDMATLYGQASITYLEKAVADPKVRDVAEFYLGQAHALFGSMDQSARATASFIATSQMPQQYKDMIRVWQGANLYQKNRIPEAMAVWDELSRKQPEAPDVLAEIVTACTRLKADCPKIIQKSAASVESGDGKKYSTLNIALGRYHLGKLDAAKAIAYLEAGRDKSNKNKIESNDPLMLVGLADAYYRTKKFSEALEIFFEMSKQFPEVRQLQEAMQGVYAMEHKSAGDVKIN